VNGELSAPARRLLLSTARGAIERWLVRAALADLACADPEVMQPRGAFVSLKCRARGTLRGCVGRTDTSEPLLTVVALSAIAAAGNDPRFPSVTADELPSLALQISVLGPLQPVRPAQVQVGVHGLVVGHLGRRGVLLPQVARERGWDRETFLSWTCRKAGLPPDTWRDPDCRIDAFTAFVFGDDEELPEKPPS
jgi:AmmeMemoRadiSam system protein A